MLRHERTSVAMALAEASHRTALRGQRTARAGVWGHELNFTAKHRKPPTPQPKLFSLYDEEPGGTRPDRMPTLFGRRRRFSGTPWTRSSTPFLGCQRSMFLCR